MILRKRTFLRRLKKFKPCKAGVQRFKRSKLSTIKYIMDGYRDEVASTWNGKPISGYQYRRAKDVSWLSGMLGCTHPNGRNRQKFIKELYYVFGELK